MSRRWGTLLAVVALTCPGAGWAVPANMVANGSFENASQAPPTGGQLALYAGSTVITGWTITGQGVDYTGTVWQAADGQRCVDLNHDQPGGMQSDPITTVVGNQYDLIFSMAGNPDAAPPLRDIKLSINGSEVKRFTFDATGVTLSNLHWRDKRLRFRATSTATVLLFESLTSGGRGPTLDNVRLYPANRPPSAPVVRGVRPGHPRVSDSLRAVAGESVDPDGDAIVYQYAWEKSFDGGYSWYAGPKTRVVAARQLAAGQMWRFRVRARDWLEPSGWVYSGAVTIGAAPASALPAVTAVAVTRRDVTQIVIGLSTSARVRIVVCNLAGRTVATIPERCLEPGLNSVLWNGRCLGGGMAPGGQYLLSVQALDAAGVAARATATLRR